ncbi:hypothetical protein JW877_05490 [bacterium]|nr:hypothetical protein [bacterium]
MNKIILFGALSVILLLVGCCKSPRNEKSSPLQGEDGSLAPGTVSQTENQEAADNEGVAVPNQEALLEVGSKVTLTGEFWGWSGTKAGCAGEISSPPVSKSDWIIKLDSGQCLYVVGPVPAGVDKLNPQGEKVEISGVVKELETGQIYIEQ